MDDTQKVPETQEEMVPASDPMTEEEKKKAAEGAMPEAAPEAEAPQM